MRIVLAPDSFKGSLTAPEAVQAIAEGILDVCPDAELVEMPMADGGDGTAEAMRVAMKGTWVEQTVCGPLPDVTVRAGFVWFPDRNSALVEMATASGLVLTPPGQRNPMRTTTYGTGELISAADHYGAEHIWLAVGGSATVDGGIGAAMALGWRFTDEQGRPVPLGGRGLTAIQGLHAPAERLQATMEVLCDVTNPLLGERGAARVFGPQKGATPDMVAELERGLTRLAEMVERTLGIDISTLPGGGAAGGLSAGAAAFMGAKLTSGATTVAKAIGLREAMADADWVLTGEGSFDSQSLGGKVISGVMESAAGSAARIGVIAGRVQLNADSLHTAGIEAAISSTPPGMEPEEAMQDAKRLVRQAAKRFAREWLQVS